MPTSRSYHDPCGIARALDVIGERWALLVVRELLLGGRRFSELRRALPRAASNMLADRLRELERHGVVGRPSPPVYELTAWGRELEPIVLALGGWALRRVPVPEGELHLSPVAVLLFLRGVVRSAAPVTLRVELDETVWTVRVEAEWVSVVAGAPEGPDASVVTSPLVLNEVIAGGFGAALERAVVAGDVVVGGDVGVVRGLRVGSGS